MDTPEHNSLSNLSAAASYRGRVRSGCLTCKARKVKCDEGRPVCHNCTRLKRTCIYKENRGQRRLSSAAMGNNASESPTSNPLEHQTPPELDSFSQHDLFINQIFTEQDFFLQDHFSVNTADILGGNDDALQLVPENYSHSYETVNRLSEQEWGGAYSFQTIEDMSSIPTSHTVSSNDFLSTDSNLNLANQQSQFGYFLDHVDPPFITPIDHMNWTRLKSYIAKLGANNQTVAAAIIAVEALYAAALNSRETTGATSSYYAAKSEYTKMLEDERQDFHTILVVTFLLCSFEVVAQHETISVTRQPDGAFVKRMEKWAPHGNFPPVSQRILAWMRILHSRAIHLGGRGLLSSKVNSLLPIEMRETPSLRLLDNDTDAGTALYDIISCPLFEFYLELQQISIEVSSLNRHHRSRGTPADESEVHQIITAIRKRLQSIWQSRSSLFRLEPADLRANLSPAVAEPIITLVGICTATYYAEIIDCGRTHGDPLLASAESKQVMRMVRSIIDGDFNACGKGDLNSAYLWPLFLYALESMEREETQWAVERLRQINNPMCHTDFLAKLAYDITEEQMAKGRRLDVRYFCAEKYGVPPPFI